MIVWKLPITNTHTITMKGINMMTKEQKNISYKNRNALRKKLGLHGYEYVLHHINPDWKHNDVERYI